MRAERTQRFWVNKNKKNKKNKKTKKQETWNRKLKANRFKIQLWTNLPTDERDQAKNTA
jgi:hypothetical protein